MRDAWHSAAVGSPPWLRQCVAGMTVGADNDALRLGSHRGMTSCTVTIALLISLLTPRAFRLLAGSSNAILRSPYRALKYGLLDGISAFVCHKLRAYL